MKHDGWFLVHRQVWDASRNPSLESVFSPREAWIYLCGEAAWQQNNGLQVGEFLGAERYLAERWKWSRSRVKRFLKLLCEEPDPMLKISRPGTVGRNGKPAVYRVIKYTAYQAKSEPIYEPISEPINSKQSQSKQEKPEPISDLNKEPRIKNTTLSDQGGLLVDQANPVGVAVGRFLSQTRSVWPLRQPIGSWARKISRDTKYASIDIVREIDLAAEWWEGSRKKPKRPDRAIRNWLENAVKYQTPKEDTDGEDFADKEAMRFRGRS